MKLIKVCGMKYPQNIQDVINLQVDYMGFICYSKSPRYIEHEQANFIKELPIAKVGVFVNAPLPEILAAVATYGFQTIQLHGQETAADCAAIRGEGLQVFKAFGIDDTFDWSQVKAYEGQVDSLLFDTKSAAHGGTGQTFDWNLLSQYPLTTPYFLSGGLRIENIQQALQLQDTRFIGLDLNSRFELHPAVKDIKLLENTLKIIRDEQVSS